MSRNHKVETFKVEKWKVNNEKRPPVPETASREASQGSMLKPSGLHLLIKAGEEINLLLFRSGKINLNWALLSFDRIHMVSAIHIH